jgi:hypothetical protein
MLSYEEQRENLPIAMTRIAGPDHPFMLESYADGSAKVVGFTGQNADDQDIVHNHKDEVIPASVAMKDSLIAFLSLSKFYHEPLMTIRLQTEVASAVRQHQAIVKMHADARLKKLDR